MPDVKKWDWTPILWIIGLVFICGMTYQQLGSMDGRVAVNTSDIKQNMESIHAEAIARTEYLGTINATKSDTTDLKAEQKELREDFSELKDYLMQYDFKPKDE